jgi:hypothetical protein
MALEIAYEAVMIFFNLALFLGVWYRKEWFNRGSEQILSKTTFIRVDDLICYLKG